MGAGTSFMMVEVFRTNVVDPDQADWIVEQIQQTFKQYEANFDLDDCDRILVVKCAVGEVQPLPVIELLKSFNYQAEVLPDE